MFQHIRLLWFISYEAESTLGTLSVLVRRHRISKSRIIFDIREVARQLKHSPSCLEYKRFGSFNLRTVQRKFESSWKEIINTAGLKYTARTNSKIPSIEELKKDLLRVAVRLNHAPARRDYERHGIFGSEIIKRRTGMKRWEDAASILGGFDPEDVKAYQNRGFRTTADWLDRVKQLSIQLGHAPTTGEANLAGINAYTICKRIRGDWVQVLESAGVDVRKRGRMARIRSTPTKVLIEDVVSVSRTLGRPAKEWEYRERGHYPSTTLRGRFGGWWPVQVRVLEIMNRTCPWDLVNTRLQPRFRNAQEQQRLATAERSGSLGSRAYS